MSDSLFQKIGGMDAVNAAVEIFYERGLKDQSIKDFYINVEMTTQKEKLKAFLAFAFGAPMAYTGKSKRNTHKQLNLTEDHFNSVSNHFVSTLQELYIKQNLIDEVAKITLSVKDEVLNR